jgi:hypothetical protein
MAPRERYDRTAPNGVRSHGVPRYPAHHSTPGTVTPPAGIRAATGTPGSGS